LFYCYYYYDNLWVGLDTTGGEVTVDRYLSPHTGCAEGVVVEEGLDLLLGSF